MRRTPAVVKRKQQVTVVKPIVIGSYAFKLTQSELSGRGIASKSQRATHRWSCVLRAPDGEDQSYYIRKVVFQLHPSFTFFQRNVEKPPYEVNESGWGEFDITAKVYFVDVSEKPVELQHTVRLYPIPSDDDTCCMRQPLGDGAACLAAETHDELIFHEPQDAFYEALISGPTKPPVSYTLQPYFLDRSALLTTYMANVAAAHTVVVSEIEAAKTEITQLARDLEEAKELFFRGNTDEATATLRQLQSRQPQQVAASKAAAVSSTAAAAVSSHQQATARKSSSSQLSTSASQLSAPQHFTAASPVTVVGPLLTSGAAAADHHPS